MCGRKMVWKCVLLNSDIVCHGVKIKKGKHCDRESEGTLWKEIKNIFGGLKAMSVDFFCHNLIFLAIIVDIWRTLYFGVFIIFLRAILAIMYRKCDI